MRRALLNAFAAIAALTVALAPAVSHGGDKPAVFESHILKTLPSATRVDLNPGTTGAASLNFGCATGVAPSSPQDGDEWCTSAGFYVRVGTTTIGPIGASTPPGGSSGQVQYNNAGVFGGFTVGGDATLNTGTGALTLAASGVSAGACGDSSHYCVPTFDAKGRATGTATYSSGAAAGGSSGQVQCNSSGVLAGIAATDTQLLIAQASGCPQGKTMSGDATIADTGALSFALNVAHTWTAAQDHSGGGSVTPRSTPTTNEGGYLGVPVDEQDGTYTLVMADAGQVVRHNSATAHTYTIPKSTTVAYPVGTTITFRNYGSGNLTLSPASGVTLLQAGSGTSASVVLTQYGFVTALMEATDVWVLTAPVPNVVYYAGANTTRTYDPGVSFVALDSCSITIAASSVSRVFMVTGSFEFAGAGTHGQWSAIYLDGAGAQVSSATWTQISGQNEVTATIGPFPVTIPGDNATHVIAIYVADANATGNLTFGVRYIYARQVS